MKTELTPPCPSCHRSVPAPMDMCPFCGAPLKIKGEVQLATGRTAPPVLAPQRPRKTVPQIKAMPAARYTGPVGEEVGNLKLVSHIGDGGMGSVYKAEHMSLGTPYAVKVLHSAMHDKRNAERFRREALVCSQLRHPNVVYVSDFGIHERLGLFMVMELLEGTTLEDYCQADPKLGIWRMVHIAEQICEGLSAAHDMGMVHRDMKPDNIFLVPRSAGRHQVKILDFGIVRLKDNHHQLTQAGAALGTPVYMSPEQIRGSKEITHSTDLYALGCIFYEMLAGVPPFMDDHHLGILRMHMAEEAAPLASHRPELRGSRMADLVHALLEKKPTARPPSVLAVLQRLGGALVELQDRGVVSAMPEAGVESRTSSMSFVAVSVPQTLTGVFIHQVRSEDPDSQLALALAHAPQLAELEPPLFFSLVWGVLARSLGDLPIPSKQLDKAADQLAQASALLLRSANAENSPTVNVTLLERSLEDLFKLLDKGRQRILCDALQPLFAEPLFPVAILPDWMLSPEEAPAGNDMSLGQKLKQDVSIASIRSLLSFGAGRKKG